MSETETTAAERLLIGEAPSTTISEDPDLQAAADAAHWSTQAFWVCYEDPHECDIDGFTSVSSGEMLESLQERMRKLKTDNILTRPGENPSEAKIFDARKLPDNPDVVVVLACEHSEVVEYRPATENKPEEIIDNSTPTALSVSKMVRGDDGFWRETDIETIAKFEEKGVGTCKKYDGDLIEDVMLERFS